LIEKRAAAGTPSWDFSGVEQTQLTIGECVFDAEDTPGSYHAVGETLRGATLSIPMGPHSNISLRSAWHIIVFYITIVNPINF
jgi:hypothetical protein